MSTTISWMSTTSRMKKISSVRLDHVSQACLVAYVRYLQSRRSRYENRSNILHRKRACIVFCHSLASLTHLLTRITHLLTRITHSYHKENKEINFSNFVCLNQIFVLKYYFHLRTTNTLEYFQVHVDFKPCGQKASP